MSARHPMSHADAAWLRMDRSTNPIVSNSLMWFDETPDWERLSATCIERIVERFPRFIQIACPGGPLGSPTATIETLAASPSALQDLLEAANDGQTC